MNKTLERKIKFKKEYFNLLRLKGMIYNETGFQFTLLKMSQYPYLSINNNNMSIHYYWDDKDFDGIYIQSRLEEPKKFSKETSFDVIVEYIKKRFVYE